MLGTSVIDVRRLSCAQRQEVACHGERAGVQQPKGRRALSIKCFMERAAEANTSSVVSLERSAVIKLALFEKHRPA